jgi:hypothetical protein
VRLVRLVRGPVGVLDGGDDAVGEGGGGGHDARVGHVVGVHPRRRPLPVPPAPRRTRRREESPGATATISVCVSVEFYFRSDRIEVQPLGGMRFIQPRSGSHLRCAACGLSRPVPPGTQSLSESEAQGCALYRECTAVAAHEEEEDRLLVDRGLLGEALPPGSGVALDDALAKPLLVAGEEPALVEERSQFVPRLHVVKEQVVAFHDDHGAAPVNLPRADTGS